MSTDNPLIIEQVRLGFQWPAIDPFLFCVHHEDAYPVGNAEQGPVDSLEGRDLGNDFEPKDGWRMYHGQTVPGFPQHPHRGFETVTIVRQGLIDHSDSLGATARFGHGDTQWLTAGKGIVHSEMFPLVDMQSPNPVELFQIWLNLPKADKMVEPHFTMLWASQVPAVTEEGVEVRVIAGALGTVKALPPPPKSYASRPDSDLAIWTIKLAAGAKWTLPAARPGTQRMLYFFAGAQLTVGTTRVQRMTGLMLKADLEAPLENTSEAEAEILILQGKPLDEPVFSSGPFVMSSPQELQQAFRDYQATQFGGWPFKRDDPVHERTQGRFARHADGTTESP